MIVVSVFIVFFLLYFSDGGCGVGGVGGGEGGKADINKVVASFSAAIFPLWQNSTKFK